MQIQSLRIRSYRSWHIDDRGYSKCAKKRLKCLEDFENLKAQGASESVILKVLGLSRSTYYRLKARYRRSGMAGLEPYSKRPKHTHQSRWTKDQEKIVLTLRQREPTWGKTKLHRLMTREYGITLSVTTVGRILKKLIQKNKIKPAYLAANKDKPKRRRVFNKHARRWKYGMKTSQPGQWVQIDHMSVYAYSKCVKHFKAVCPFSKVMVCEVYSSASSKNASLFLKKVIAEMPFPIESLQVDGGSEFRHEFEAACEQLGLPLYVLPPRSPKYNGVVERCNGVTRDDFYSRYQDVFDVPTIRKYLPVYQAKYNHYRPHQALQNLTPMEYITHYKQNRAA